MDNHIPLELAQEILFNAVSPVATYDEVPLIDSYLRVSYDSLISSLPQPPFHRVLMDGYALYHEDILSASKSTPVLLPVTQHLFAGSEPGLQLERGSASRVMTGAMLPPGATCVIRQEDTDEGEQLVTIYAPSEKYKNCRMKGEDLQTGETLIEKGDEVQCLSLGLLAGQGVKKLRVFSQPKVAILATGDELYTQGGSLPKGKIFNTSSLSLRARLLSIGADVTSVDVCGDDIDTIYKKICSLFECNDMVITTGGVAVGQHDHMPRLAQRIVVQNKGKVLFQSIKIKPGTRTIATLCDNKVLLSLSGNPSAALASFEMLAVPTLRKMSGRTHFTHVHQTCELGEDFLRGRKKSRMLLLAEVVGKKVFLRESGEKAGIGPNPKKYNCFIDIPEQCIVRHKGDDVAVIIL